ncbi:MAG: hypothetical protein KC910_11815, partial [Candidatus Eremiobacteraeota bacterium]|nr:hypothetical protein [Candidatus Eremiobacteraeota bacterium]
EARRKLLDSAPPHPAGAYLILLRDALRQAGFDPGNVMITQAYQDRLVGIRLALNGEPALLNQPSVVFRALEAPFSRPEPALNQFTRFAFWAVGLGGNLRYDFRGPDGRGEFSLLSLGGDAPTKTCALPNQADEVRIELSPHPLPDYPSLSRLVANAEWLCHDQVRLWPGESLRAPGEGNTSLAVGARPCNLLQTFFDGPGLGLTVEGDTYQPRGPGLYALEQRPDRRFFFLRWRPDYGRPSWLQQFEGQAFGSRSCRAVFWVAMTRRPAEVALSPGDYFSETFQLQGPPGLDGRVVWPGLKRDVWGYRLVRDEVFEQAMEWCTSVGHEMAATIKVHLEDLLDQISASNLWRSGLRERLRQEALALWG